jgi:HAD superfamily hydrolase (TIGR01509 family)
MSLRAAIFDLDNTLHDKAATEWLLAVEQYETFALDGLGVQRIEWLDVFAELHAQRISKPEVFDQLGRRFRLSIQASASLLEHFDSTLGSRAISLPGATELIYACKFRGLKVGIITNGRDAFQRSKVAGLGLTNAIDAVFTSGGIGFKKPDLRIFEACLAALAVEPSEAVYVGDDFAADMEPALALGMVAVWKSTATSEQVAFSSNLLSEIQAFIQRAP